MSRYATSFVLGYHGCDRSVGEAALWGKLDLIHSDKEYDWLGPGIYFWEGDPVRALEWATEKAARGQYREPFVIGAIIDLGNCLDLLVRENLELLRWSYDDLASTLRAAGLATPKNEDARLDASRDKLLRKLDCAVIRNLHGIIEGQSEADIADIGYRLDPFDTVRGLFTEGDQIYPGSGFYRRSHTQVAVRNSTCVKGVFLPQMDGLTATCP